MDNYNTFAIINEQIIQCFQSKRSRIFRNEKKTKIVKMSKLNKRKNHLDSWFLILDAVENVFLRSICSKQNKLKVLHFILGHEIHKQSLCTLSAIYFIYTKHKTQWYKMFISFYYLDPALSDIWMFSRSGVLSSKF